MVSMPLATEILSYRKTALQCCSHIMYSDSLNLYRKDYPCLPLIYSMN